MKRVSVIGHWPLVIGAVSRLFCRESAVVSRQFFSMEAAKPHPEFFTIHYSLFTEAKP